VGGSEEDGRPGGGAGRADESGLPAAELLVLSADASVKQELIDNTERSVARGTFGSPSFYVGDELFFGKDRLPEVEEEINAQQQQRATRPQR
jgi:2-hydroxychromene-2-carboxylate isomerase